MVVIHLWKRKKFDAHSSDKIYSNKNIYRERRSELKYIQTSLKKEKENKNSILKLIYFRKVFN